MDNTVGSVIKSIRELDGLIERVDSAREGSDISGADIIMIVTILEEVRQSILKAPAYPPIHIGDE